ncbi:MAG: oligosaccharide flippase family protein [Chloroflexia bacterium]|nr:oligosaccharide flippase family protein [Chloroflexia bacterium]
MQFLTIAASIVVARVAGPTVMGTVAWALAYVQMLGFIADLGLGTAHIKMISEGKDLDKCIGTFIFLKLSASFLYFLVFMGNYLFQKFILGNEFESQTHEYVVFISLGMLMLQDIQTIASSTFAGKTEQAKQDIPYMIRGIMFQIFRVVIVLLGGKAVALAFGNLAAGILIFPFYVYLFKKYPIGKFDKTLAKQYLKIAAPVLILGAATTLTNTIDKVLLQEFADSEQVGYYTAGFRVGGFILLISRSMSLLFFPMFSAAVAKGDFNYIKEKIFKFERFSFLFILPVVILITLYAEDVVMILLGDQYTPSIKIMAIVTVALFLDVFNTPYGNVITGLGKFKLVAVISIANLMVYAGLLLFFLTNKELDHGSQGVAYSLLIVNTLVGITYRYFSTRATKVIDNKMAIKFILYGILNYLICWYFFS